MQQLGLAIDRGREGWVMTGETLDYGISINMEQSRYF